MSLPFKKKKALIKRPRLIQFAIIIFTMIVLAYMLGFDSPVKKEGALEENSFCSKIEGSFYKKRDSEAEPSSKDFYCQIEKPYYKDSTHQYEHSCKSQSVDNQSILSELCVKSSCPSRRNRNSSSRSPKWDLFSCGPAYYKEGWSFDIGGQFTWVALSSLNLSGGRAFSENTTGLGGGFTGKVSYQQPHEVFAQLRGTYNSVNMNEGNRIQEAYAELVAGYCLLANPFLTLTPYAGIGYDKLTANYSYKTYYGIVGLDTHYAWAKWKVGTQFDFYFPFQQQVNIAGANTSLAKEAGCAARLPIAHRLSKYIWLELAPYYRFFVFGSSAQLQEEVLNEVGAFLTLRIFM